MGLSTDPATRRAPHRGIRTGVKWLTRARDAVVEAVLAGLVVGLVEGATVAVPAHAGLVGGLAIAAAGALTLIAAALVARAGLAVLVRVPLIEAWVDDLRGGGAPRARAAFTTVMIALLMILYAWIAFRVFAWAHVSYRFNDADAIGALVIAIYISLAVALALGASTLHRRISPHMPEKLLDGRRAGMVLAAVGLTAWVAIPTIMITRAVPAFDVAPVSLALLLVAVLIVLIGLDAATKRIARWGALVAVLGAFAGTWSLKALPRARLAIVEHGDPSKLTAVLVWQLADGDGDGFPGPSVGGADCDDANPSRNPGALEIAGNGIDENCTGADAPARPPPAAAMPTNAGKPNIILISVDALRADRIGAYGYARKTPVIDKLAGEGVHFTRAFTSCPSTRCAIPALHTGMFRPAPTAPTVAANLRAAGYDTAAITCCERFADADRELVGFRTIDASADATRMQRAGQSNGDVVVDRALSWLSTNATKPWFLWVHLYEPHFPYEAPAGPDLGDSESDRYDREVAYVDFQIGRLLAIDPTALVILTADHGEELDEHGIRFHARSLYNQVIRVPLIIRGPGVAPRIVDTPVSIVDIVPTILELAGALPVLAANGHTLAPALRGEPLVPRPILVELAHDHQIKRDMAAVVQPPWKVIWDRQANAWSLFKVDDLADETDLSADPALATMQALLRETLDRETRPLLR